MEITQQTRTAIALAAAVLVLGAAAYFFWYRTGVAPAEVATDTSSAATSSAQSTTATTSSVAGDSAVSGTGSFTVTQISDTVSDPSLKSLIDLGTTRKNAGDFSGAASAWERASALYPDNVISFNNLGDLYMNFMRKYSQAESNYLKQIVNAPTDLNAYSTLATLYSELYKQGTSAAEDILKKGIAANPKAVSLQAALAQYYRDAGRIADAKVQYQIAIDNAKALGLTSVAAQLQSEKDSF